MTVALSTHGVIVPLGVPVHASDIQPELETEDVHPVIVAKATDAPEFKIEEPAFEVRPEIRQHNRRR